MSTTPLAGKKIVFGITGSIAAYKCADWLRALRNDGAEVKVVITEAGSRFISPLSLAVLSGNRVYDDMFASDTAAYIPHITLAREADLVLIAPATAQTIAALARGDAGNLLTAIVLATKAKVLICPAMNSGMFTHPATQLNIAALKKFGYGIVEPDEGAMACGEEGPGRLPTWETVRDAILQNITRQDLTGRSVLITAGPTWEPLDPVRFLTNRSTGKMGYAMAKTARRRGAEVTLVSGPVNLPAPAGVQVIRIKTADDMYEAVMNRYKRMSILVMTAAVSDFRPARSSPHKIKKTGMDPNLALTPNRDILLELGRQKKISPEFPLLVGFAAESRDHLKEGRRKLLEKNLDLMVVNDITGKHSGFEADTNQVTLLFNPDKKKDLPLLSKEETSDLIWDHLISVRK